MTNWREISVLIGSTPAGLAAMILTLSASCFGQLAITEYPIPNSIVGVTSGPDGAVWFTEFAGLFGGAFIGRITTTGTVTQYTLPPQPAPLFRHALQVLPPGGGGGPLLGGITTGPDGALWFGVSNPGLGGGVGRITTSGSITEAQVPEGVNALVTGSDGAVWFIGNGSAGNVIHRITVSGTVTDIPLPGVSPGLVLFDIAAGPDSALWITAGDNKIAELQSPAPSLNSR
jgi:virginiamycin B lyase